MSRIAIDARELRTTTGRYIERLLHYLQQIDQANEYIVFLKPADFDGWQPTSKNFTKLVCPHKEFSFDEQIGFAKQLNELRPDLVHFPMVQQPIAYRGKVVTTMNDLTTIRFKNKSKNQLVFTLKQQVYRWVNMRAAKKSAVIITYTKFVKDDVVNFAKINPNKIVVTNLAADKITAKSEPFTNMAGEQFLLYVGRPMTHKNLERLIEAFALLKVQHPKLKLVLAGRTDANYTRLQAWVQQKDIKDVIFTDYISEGQLRWLYENCAAYVLPSLSEGFGLPSLEAMMHGAPVVSSNATCLPEVNGEAAKYFDPLNIDDMAAAIDEVIIDKKLRQKLIEAGQIQAAKYSWQRCAEQTLEVYKQALGY